MHIRTGYKILQHSWIQFFSIIILILSLLLSWNVGKAQNSTATGSYVPPLPSSVASTPEWISQLTQKSENYFLLGTKAFDEERYNSSREYFNLSIDTLLEFGSGVRSNVILYTYYLQLVERIRHYDIQMQQTEVGWGQQAYVPSQLDLLAQIDVKGEDGSSIDVLNDLDFPVVLTPEVQSFIRYFTGSKGRATTVSGLRRAGRFFHLARRIFAEEKVPLDLIWLAQAESGWKNNALSTAAAYGIWQFMPATGARFGLAQNGLIDERGGFEQPTRAAAKYLRWLYNRYGDWLLAMAAYNCGEGNVDKALARSTVKDFWSLHRQNLLPQETRNYVPIILSIILIAKHPDRYGLENIRPDSPLSYESIQLTAAITLNSLSASAGVSLDKLKELNPELLQLTTPQQYRLRIPRGTQSTIQPILANLQATSSSITPRFVRKKLGH